MAHIDTETRHKAVNLLTDFQKRDGAQEPDKHISRDGFFPVGVHLRLYFTFCHSKRRHTEHTNHDQHDGEHKQDSVSFFIDSPLQ